MFLNLFTIMTPLVCILLLLNMEIYVVEAKNKTYIIDQTYYNMTVHQNSKEILDKYYVDMKDAQLHQFLSIHSQAAWSVSLKFMFPFYGHIIENFYVTTHGFLSFAPRLHNLLYKTQYIAPLRVKLDPSRSNDSIIKYLSEAERFVVQWSNVRVAKPFAHPNGGHFSFQVILKKSGEINFVYIDIPEVLKSDALFEGEPVAGISDAFLMGNKELHVYHTASVSNSDINTGTVVIFHAKPTCVQQDSCETCHSMRQKSNFVCSWCPQLNRCSDGVDRSRELWEQNQCELWDLNDTRLGNCSNNMGYTEWRDSRGMKIPIEIATEDTSSVTTTAISVTISLILIVIIFAILCGFVYTYGKTNGGGIAEKLALRMESNYKRFGISEGRYKTKLKFGSLRSKKAQEPANEEQINNSTLNMA